MPLNEYLIWVLFFLVAIVAIYGYRILHTQVLKTLANTARIKSNPKSLKKINKQIKKDYPSFVSTLIGALLSVGIVFALYKYVEGNRINTISEFQAIATTAMKNECTTSCAAYGITQAQLVGPQLEQDCCYGIFNRPDYIFMWQSDDPKVILKERVDTSGANAVWVGNPINANKDIESPILVRNDMDNVIQQNQNIIDAAYKHALQITPSMHASFAVVHLIIAPNGQVTDSSIISTDINSAEFKNNLIKIFSNLHFSTGNFQTTYYIYHLQLKQK